MYAVAADRKAASRLDSSLRSKHSSGLPRRPTSAKVSHTIPSTTSSTRFLSSQQQAFGYTTYYYYTVDSTVCCVPGPARARTTTHLLLLPRTPPQGGLSTTATGRGFICRTPSYTPFFKVSSAWKSDVKRNITQKSDPLFLLA